MMWRSQRYRTRPVVALLAVTLIGSGAGPAVAAPPERFEEAPTDVFADDEHRLAVFVNTTRQEVCDWLAAGAQDELIGLESITVQVKETGKGALVVSGRGVVPVELWQMDDDVPPLVDPCVDTDDQDGPWATGTARVVFTDNDADVSLTRTNSFGGTMQATVTDDEGGTWRYTNIARFQVDRDDEFHVRALTSNLRQVGR